ncbi:MAG: DUF2442 domain-containing protein [Pseudomonadota bacterium]
MVTLEIDEDRLQVDRVVFSADHFAFVMADGRRIEAPLWWYPRLHSALAEERENWEVLPFGDAVGWAELDEFVSAKALIVGGPAPGALPPAEAAE